MATFVQMTQLFQLLHMCLLRKFIFPWIEGRYIFEHSPRRCSTLIYFENFHRCLHFFFQYFCGECSKNMLSVLLSRVILHLYKRPDKCVWPPFKNPFHHINLVLTRRFEPYIKGHLPSNKETTQFCIVGYGRKTWTEREFESVKSTITQVMKSNKAHTNCDRSQWKGSITKKWSQLKKTPNKNL